MSKGREPKAAAGRRRAGATAPRTEVPGIDRRMLAAALLGLCLLAGLAYANSFRAELFFDNATIIREDPRLRAWNAENLHLVLTKTYWSALSDSDLYRPITTLSYLFNYSVLDHGEHPGGYHAVNLLLHLANAMLVLLLVWRLFGRFDTAWATAALFAVLPVHTEAVTNIVGRADLLATLAVVAGTWCYVRAVDGDAKRRGRWLVATSAAACVAVLSKENGVMIVGAVLLFHALWKLPTLPLRDPAWRSASAIRQLVPTGWVALLPALGLFAATRWWFHGAGAGFAPPFVDNPLAHAALLPRALTAVNVLGRYLLRLIFPWELSADYSYSEIPLYGDGPWSQEAWTWVSVAIVAGLVGAAIWWRRARLFSWGVLWLLVMQLPTSNLLIPIGSIMAERFLYLPSVGFSALAAAALLGLGRRIAAWTTGGRPRRLLTWAPIAIVIVLFAARTYARNHDWRDELVFWRSTIATSPNSHKAHRGYARALWNAGQTEASADAAFAAASVGMAVLERAELPLERQDNQLLQDLGTNAHNQGQFLQQRGDTAAAVQRFRAEVGYLERAVRVDRAINEASRRERLRRGAAPEAVPSLGNPRPHIQLANAYLALGDPVAAWEASLDARRFGPGEESAYIAAGIAAFNAGRPRDAAGQFLTVLLLNAAHPDAWDYLSRAYQALGLEPPIDPMPGGGYTLRLDAPAVQTQLMEAAVGLVARFAAAGRSEEAEYFRSLAIGTYGVPASAFSAPRP